MMQNTLWLTAWELMNTARAMAELYDEHRQDSRYVHSTSKGHEAIQLALGLHLQPQDFASLYYRDESVLLGMGFEPYELMLQLLAKADDPFSGGRTYYAHPSVRRMGMPTIPHQSSATGMQAIPAVGMAHAIAYFESQNLPIPGRSESSPPLVVCSLGDGSVTEGEVAEALQMAVLKRLPIVFLVQDNEWGISASAQEMRAMDAYHYADGFKGLKRMRVKGNDFMASCKAIEDAFGYCRSRKGPVLLHAAVPLLGHHTSGVRKEWYRTEKDLSDHERMDPLPRLRKQMLKAGYWEEELDQLAETGCRKAASDFERARQSPDPEPHSVYLHEFVPGGPAHEQGVREPEGREKVVMVDAALHAVEEILKCDPAALLYGQDVGKTLGGVFREAATLADKFGDERVFNTPIQEAYLIGSTAGMSAVGAKPIVEIQFADYIWSGINQLVVELSKSCYLSRGQFPVQSLIRVPCGAYGGGGPYHSGCVESSVLNIRGIKVVYPSNAADMKGLMKAAFLDPNPVVFFEHKGLYWSKVPGTEAAKTPEPSEDYVVPLGKARVALEASQESVRLGDSCLVVTYGMGVHWALNAARTKDGNPPQGATRDDLIGRVEILDLRTLYPLDETMVMERSRVHGKVLVLTEEPLLNSFAESLAFRIQRECFEFLDGPVEAMGAVNLPAVPLNIVLEAEMLPSTDKVAHRLRFLLAR
ncbi:MAG: tungsten formylmethanofuran dehydrogenase [Sphingomonadales bacterium]|nr:tungsten formylmethanofuran dehydrogenase [Sphingomonadales bacterium]